MMTLVTNMVWVTFVLCFALMAKTLWFYYYFSIYVFNKKDQYAEYNGKVTLVVPVYNEDSDKLRDTIEAAKKVKGLSKIIFVNDGSSNDVLKTLISSYDASYTIIDLENNAGKRNAQADGIKFADLDTDVFVFMDSDTVLLDENTILNLTRPMSDPNIGGVTGCIFVMNEYDNYLTKSLSAMYWAASKIWRKGPSNYGFVQVANGQLSCYRASIIRDIMPTYTNQEFMGVICTLSDDRYLTHHIQTDYNKQMIYADDAECYTYVPNTIKGAYKMILRWQKGKWRESLLLLKRGHKKPLLTTDVWVNHLVQICQMIIRITMIILSIFVSPWYMFYYLIMIMIISVVFAYDMLFRNFKMIPYRILYSLLNEFIFSWTYIHGLFLLKQQGKWATR